jgi:hypothetical protein
VIWANSAMSKSPPGTPVGPKITFAARGYSVMVIPMSFSSDLTIASVFVRVAFDDVHDQRKVAGKPEHVHVPPAPGELGPPVQCFFRSASALFGL